MFLLLQKDLTRRFSNGRSTLLSTHRVFSEKYKAAELLVLPQSGHFTLITELKLVNFQTEEVLEKYKLYRAQSGRGLRRRAWPKKGVAVDSGTPFSSPN